MARFITGVETTNAASDYDRKTSVSTVSVFKAYHISGDLFLPINESRVVDDYKTHSRLLTNSGIDRLYASPMTYLRIEKRARRESSENSSLNSIASAREYYNQIEKRLIGLLEEEDDESVEEEAIETARLVLRHLEQNQISPPAISWHGGDAVVMLWSLGGTTYAMTITDGEIGYVIRRGRKEIKSKDSMDVNSFSLAELSE